MCAFRLIPREKSAKRATESYGEGPISPRIRDETEGRDMYICVRIYMCKRKKRRGRKRKRERRPALSYERSIRFPLSRSLPPRTAVERCCCPPFSHVAYAHRYIHYHRERASERAAHLSHPRLVHRLAVSGCQARRWAAHTVRVIVEVFRLHSRPMYACHVRPMTGPRENLAREVHVTIRKLRARDIRHVKTLYRMWSRLENDAKLMNRALNRNREGGVNRRINRCGIKREI